MDVPILKKKVKFKVRGDLCHVADCLGVQEYQPIIVVSVWDVPDAPPVVVDVPLKVCRLHKTIEIGALLMTQENWDMIGEVFAEKGLAEPRKELARVQFRTLPPRDIQTTIVIPPGAKT